MRADLAFQDPVMARRFVEVEVEVEVEAEVEVEVDERRSSIQGGALEDMR